MNLKNVQGHQLSFERVKFESGTPADEDHLLLVSVRLGDYSARDEIWIDGAHYAEFLAQLEKLEQSRKGEAVLRSMSPEDLRICLKSISHPGAMSVEGFIGWSSGGSPVKLSFAFAFDPGDLQTFLREAEALERASATHGPWRSSRDAPEPQERPRRCAASLPVRFLHLDAAHRALSERHVPLLTDCQQRACIECA